MSDNESFVASMEQATIEIIEKTSKNMQKACLLVEADAKKECPVDMGVLRASITSDVQVDESGITGIIGSNLEYAPYVHNGTGVYAKDGNGRKTPWAYVSRGGKYKGYHFTKGQKPQPFLENAKLNNMNKISRMLGGK